MHTDLLDSRTRGNIFTGQRHNIQILTADQMQDIRWRRGQSVAATTYSSNLLAQIHDIAEYWGREQLSRDTLPGWRRALVKGISRAISIPTWRLAYVENIWRNHDPAAVGVHFTCRKV